MWSPVYIHLENFLSHKDTQFQFNKGTVTLITGKNNDDSDQESNGSGKSGLIEAVCWTLLGQTFRKIKSNAVIHEKHDNCKCTFVLKNLKSDQVFKIVRKSFRKKHKSSSVEIFLNDQKPNFSMTSVGETNQRILGVLGLRKEDILNYFIISKEKFKPFFELRDSEAKELIATFTNFTNIDDEINRLKGEIKEEESKITDYNLERSNLLGKIEGYEDIDHKPKDNSSEIQIYTQRIKKAEDRIAELKLKLIEITPIGKNLKKEFEIIKNSKPNFDENREKFKKVFEENKIMISEIIPNRDKGLRVIQKDKTFLLGEVACPACDHRFNPTDDDRSIEHVQAMLIKKQNKLKKIQANLDDLEKAQQLISTNIKEIDIKESDFNKKYLDIQKKYNDAKIQYRNIQQEIKNYETSYIPSQKRFLEEAKKPIEVVDYSEKIKDLEAKVSSIDQDIKKSEELILLYKNAQITASSFKTYLANKTLLTIENYTNYFLEEIESKIRIKISGYRTTGKGKLNETITTSVVNASGYKKDYGSFSSGEKVRIVIANILAQARIINSTSKTGGLDLLMLDEIVESVDPTGIANFLKSLNNTKKTICLITHARYNESYQGPKILVIKEGGYSKIND